MHLKVFVKLKKPLKTLSSGQKTPKKKQKNPKNPKKPKKTHWAGFKKKTRVFSNPVGSSTTLAWPGWKQPVIPVEVDTARLATCRCKNGFAKCVLLYFRSLGVNSRVL